MHTRLNVQADGRDAFAKPLHVFKLSDERKTTWLGSVSGNDCWYNDKVSLPKKGTASLQPSTVMMLVANSTLDIYILHI